MCLIPLSAEKQPPNPSNCPASRQTRVTEELNSVSDRHASALVMLNATSPKKCVRTGDLILKGAKEKVEVRKALRCF